MVDTNPQIEPTTGQPKLNLDDVNIRISSKDLRSLQRRALADGIPYQTLVANVLHKFVEGRLSERI